MSKNSFNDESIKNDSLKLKKECIKIWIEDSCSRLGFYDINNDFSINVRGDILITDKYFGKIIPDFIHFNTVTGDFKCRIGKLKSLVGFFSRKSRWRFRLQLL